MLALVTGATGAVGPTLVRALVDRGHRARVLVRRPPPPGLLPAEGVACVEGALEDDATLAAAIDGVDVVFHLAAKLHVNNPGPELAAEYERVNVGAVERLLAVAARTGRPRVVFFSTICVYEPTAPGQERTEADEARADTLYGQTKRRAEALVRGYGNGVILRLAAVYGPAMRGNYVHLARVFRRGVGWMVGDGRNRRTLVHVRDVAEAALLAAERPEAAGRTYNVTDGEVHTFDEIARAIQRAVGRAPGVRYVPARPIRGALRLAEAVAAPVLRGRTRPTALLEKLTEDVAVRGDLIREELGFRPRYGLEAGWRDALAQPTGAR